MSIQLGYACVTCKRLAPNVGDGGYLGAPTLDVAEETTVGILGGEGMPSFGLFYAGLAALGLLPHDIERAREFMAEHAGHRLFITGGDVDGDDVPDDLREFEEDENDNIPEEMDALDAERERRVASGEFIEGHFAVSCAACRSELKSTDAELLKAREGKTVSQADARTFVAAWDRAPDDGWNHRLMGIADPYESFMPELVEFVRKHAAHGLASRILPAPVGGSHYQSRRTL
jgi:hypothetical protein